MGQFPVQYIQVLRNSSALVIIVAQCSNWLVCRCSLSTMGFMNTELSTVSVPRRDIYPAQRVILAPNCTICQSTALNSDIPSKQKICGTRCRTVAHSSPQYFFCMESPHPIPHNFSVDLSFSHCLSTPRCNTRNRGLGYWYVYTP
jgi:hypothetical protein